MILDDDFNPPLTVTNILKRWETKRVRFNVTLLIFIVIMSGLEHLINSKDSSYWTSYWREVSLCLLIANVAFSVVYLLEFWAKFKTRHFLTTLNSIRLFEYGLSISIVIVVITGIISIFRFQ